eukprot:CAMPEP_0196575838 /NCGR_PEP_ID=MMETSP1081-20130531/5227_1 /TAXON_ID=36882 /ORGANISM="Pyramimonas amylifera, Strain CCMP720" /LENGTH=976 /DNA_ID=CAMNT_0041894257 /DNA_START=94 /DNA_END=3024 /DNA_ORIENTATION=+
MSSVKKASAKKMNVERTTKQQTEIVDRLDSDTISTASESVGHDERNGGSRSSSHSQFSGGGERSSLLGGTVASEQALNGDAASVAFSNNSSEGIMQSELVSKVRAEMKSQSRIIEENIRVHQSKLHFQRDEANRISAETLESESLQIMEKKEREFTLWQLSKDLKDRSHRKELKVVLNNACSMLKDVQLELSHQYQAQAKLAQVRQVLKQKRQTYSDLSRTIEDREALERLELTESHQREARNLANWCELDLMHLSTSQLENQRTRDRLCAQQIKEKQQKEAEQHRELQILKSKYSMNHFDAELVYAEEYERLVADESVATNALVRRHKNQKKALKNKLLMAREAVRQKGHAAMQELRVAHVQEQQEKRAKELKLQQAEARTARSEQFKEELEERKQEFIESEDLDGSAKMGSGLGSGSHASSVAKSSKSSYGNKDQDVLYTAFSPQQGHDGIMNTELQDGQMGLANEDLTESLAAHQKEAEKLIAGLLAKQKIERTEREEVSEKACKELVSQWEAQSARIKHEHEQNVLQMRQSHSEQKAELQAGHDREIEALEHSLKLERRVRKQDVDEKVVSSQAKSEFLSFVCHELRNPLSGVLVIADLLLASPGMSRDLKQQINIIQKEANTMCSIVNDVLDYAKIEAGMLVLDPVDFNLYSLLGKILKEFQEEVIKKKLRLEYDFGKNVPQMVYADPVRLKQVLTNLLSNAVKFTTKGVIKVSVALESTLDQGQYLVVFSVSDTGVGIPAEALPHVFSAFSQSNPSSTRQLGGSGLGLGISKALVEQLGGTITVTSHTDKGSVFRFSVRVSNTQAVMDTVMPLDDSASEVTGSNADSADQLLPVTTAPAFPKVLKVLVVEDSVTLLRLWAKLVRNLGCEVDTAPNGQEALDKCAANVFDVVLMDISMPKLSGDKAVQQLRGSGWKNIVIALTANANNADIASYIELGFDSVITKPFQMETLREVILEQIKKREETAALSA